ncbi:MAG: GyrI-like domain-containing protein [Halobacteriota archaeon]|nr:GyrI-like domain-containing protein [Halobacteriota archaeon]
MAGDDTVKPEKIEIIKRKEPLKVMGSQFYGDPFHSEGEWSVKNEIGLLWQRFGSLLEKNRDAIDKIRLNKETAYEIHIQPEDYKDTKKYYVFVGVEVKEFTEMPIEFVGKVFPTTMYAVFTFKGEEMFRGGDFIWQEWLRTSSEYEEAYPCFIEVYNETRFFGLDNKNSEIDYHIPVRLREGD